jgi:hypothetical protein
MYGFVSQDESVKLRECLREISAAGPKLYTDNEKHLLVRCRDSCKGSECKSTLCKNLRYYTQHESNVIYAIHCRIPREPDKIPQGDTKSPAVIKPEPERKGKAWMS